MADSPPNRLIQRRVLDTIAAIETRGIRMDPVSGVPVSYVNGDPVVAKFEALHQRFKSTPNTLAQSTARPCEFMLHRSNYMGYVADGTFKKRLPKGASEEVILSHFPEQSLAAIDVLIEDMRKRSPNKAWPFFEVDFYFTPHGLLVNHDRVNHRTGRVGEVVDLTSTNPKKIWKLKTARLMNGEHIPRLDDLFERMQAEPKLCFTLEAKTLASLNDINKSHPNEDNPAGHIDAAVDALIELLLRMPIPDLAKRVEFISFDPQLLKALRSALDKKGKPFSSIKLLFIYQIRPEDEIDKLIPYLVMLSNRESWDGLHFNAGLLTGKIIQFIKSEGLLVYSYPEKGFDNAELLCLAVDKLETDFIEHIK